MLSNSKIIIASDTVVNGTSIASFSASLKTDSMELTMAVRHNDKDACKMYRDVVRADQQKFEDYAYSLQDMLKNTDTTI